MRLTLRTLLAYMDDILDPADKEELAKKIESSEFADDLIHRTRDTMRRLRLSAPQVMATGMGLDPNTVSEYLDNVLPPDSVGDFERICLESDMHLAEVASSHHVLTMVLGEPADVDPAMRQRMYSIPLEAEGRKRVRMEAAHTGPETARAKAAATGAASPPATTTGAPRSAPTTGSLPEYLRTSVWSRYHVALTGVAAVLLVAVTAFLATGLQDWLRGRQQAAADATAGRTTELPPPSISKASPGPPSAVDEGAGGGVTREGEQTEQLAGQAAAGRRPETHTQVGTGMNASPLPPLTSSLDAGGETAVAAPTAPAAASSAAQSPAHPSGTMAVDVGLVPGPVGDTTTTTPVTPSAVPPVEPPMGAGPAAAGALPEVDLRVASSAPQGGDTTLGEGGAAKSSDEGPGAVEPLADVGTYLGGKVVLLRYDGAAGAWFRLPSRSSVANGEELLALPAFRPKITLASGVHVDLSGGTQIVVRTAEVAEADALAGVNASTPAVELVYGRIVLINTANEDNQVLLKFGPAVGDAQLARGATLAVEAERSYVPGRDPRTSPSPLVVHLYASKGEIIWRGEGSETTIREPAQWTIADGVASAIAADPTPPEWIDQEPVEQRSEQLGALVIEESLDDQRPVDNQLLELFETARRREVKSLAARSSIHVGLFEPFVEALRDSEQRPNWRTHIDTLRAAMALSPDSANKVWQTLVEQRGETAAADLYEMLCGYGRKQIGHTPEEVETGALARLINWLEDDNLDYRVLAAHNLREITGKNLLSNPAGSLTERALGVRRWRERLKAGELVPLADHEQETK